jgi:type I restriction enzyme, S subunit
MGGEWTPSVLGDLVEIKHGFAFPGEFIRDEAVGDVLVTPGNVAIGGGFKAARFKYYDGDVPDGFVLTEGDLVVSMTDLSKEADTLGAPALIPKADDGRRYLHNQRLGKVVVVSPTKLDLRFLSYLLRSAVYRAEVLAGATGTTVRHTSPERIRRFEFHRPPLVEQQAIAHILGTLDDKIELNRRMSETLAAMGRALFRSWFVNFDPVHRNSTGHVTKAFPDSFDDATPAGWRYRPLGEVVELTRGATYKSALKNRPGPVLLGLGSISRNGGFREDNLATYGGESPDSMVLSPGDLYVSLKDVTQSADLLGAIARVPLHVRRGRLTQDTVKLNFTSPSASRQIVYQTLLTDEYREFCRAHATGTTNLGLSREDFLSYPIIDPGAEVQNLFERNIEGLDQRAGAATTESRTLAALRDTLLPKLISGELRVKDAEKIAARAL